MSRPGVRADRAKAGVVDQTKTTLSASRYGSGLNSTELMTLKIAVFAPIPRASVTSATTVNAGLLLRDRDANRKILPKVAEHGEG